MDTYQMAKQLINSRKQKIRKKNSEIEELRRQIRVIRENPKYAMQLDEVAKHMKYSPDCSEEEYKEIVKVLNIFQRKIYTEEPIETLFELSLLTKSQVLEKPGIDETDYYVLRKLLIKFGLVFKNEE